MTETTKRSVVLRGRRTAVSLEDPFWKELRRIARGLECSCNELIAEIDCERRKTSLKVGQLSNALRLYIFNDVQARAKHFAVTESVAAVETIQ